MTCHNHIDHDTLTPGERARLAKLIERQHQQLDATYRQTGAHVRPAVVLGQGDSKWWWPEQPQPTPPIPMLRPVPHVTPKQPHTTGPKRRYEQAVVWSLACIAIGAIGMAALVSIINLWPN